MHDKKNYKINYIKAGEICLQILTGKIFMKRKLKMEVKREKTLLEIILNSTLVSTEIMKMKKIKKKRVYGRLTKTKTGKGSMQQHY